MIRNDDYIVIDMCSLSLETFLCITLVSLAAQFSVNTEWKRYLFIVYCGKRKSYH